MSELKSVNFEVFGRVQGVFFRKYTREQAKKLGLNGYVQNTTRGTVVGTMQGKKPEITKMKEWLATTGSPKSKIDRVQFGEEKSIEKCTYGNFDIVYEDGQ